jgi:hypothetical protein
MPQWQITLEVEIKRNVNEQGKQKQHLNYKREQDFEEGSQGGFIEQQIQGKTELDVCKIK